MYEKEGFKIFLFQKKFDFLKCLLFQVVAFYDGEKK